MKVLVCGCIHGQFALVQQLQSQHNPDLTILLGDLQAVDSAQQLAASSILPNHDIPLEFQAYNPQHKTLAIFGNHELFIHCDHGGRLLKSNLYVLGTGQYLYRGAKIAAFSGIQRTRKTNPYFINDDFLRHFDQDFCPDLIISHQWPKLAASCNKSFLKGEINSSLQQNLCDTYLQRFQFKQQTIYLAAHMHVNGKGYIYQKGKCSIKFQAFGLLRQGGWGLIELQPKSNCGLQKVIKGNIVDIDF